jgi:hypothetical protein
VVATGNNEYGQCNVGNWTNIVQVAAGWYHTVGLKSDGTVVAVGDNPRDPVLSKGGPCDVGNWTDIVQVAAGAGTTVGLKRDGTVVATGSNSYWNCEVSDWNLINKPIHFPDANLEASIRQAINKPIGCIYQSDLGNLTSLSAAGKGISDLSGLGNCTKLTFLDLNSNRISDIKPLVDNPGLRRGDTVDLTRNPLSSSSINRYIPALERRGVTVYYDPSYSIPELGITLKPTPTPTPTPTAQAHVGGKTS